MALPTTDPATGGRRWTAGRVVAAILVAGMVAMWAYVLYLAIGPGRQPPPDRLDDPAFSTAAELRCGRALDAVAALPRASEVATAGERATVVAEANRALAEMLDDLDRIAPGGEDGAIVQEWLDDWRTYLDDREAFATALRSDPDARLLVSAKDNDQITEHLDAFAADNHMPACATPLDV
jgi:hypothetical protein